MFPAGIEGTPPMGVKRKGKDKKQNKKNSELLCKRDYTMCNEVYASVQWLCAAIKLTANHTFIHTQSGKRLIINLHD